jgi:hypothetical protein
VDVSKPDSHVADHDRRVTATIDAKTFNNINGGAARESLLPSVDMVNMQYEEDPTLVLTPELRTPASFMGNLKAIISFLQIAVALNEFVSMGWPSFFRTLVSYFAFVNLEVNLPVL